MIRSCALVGCFMALLALRFAALAALPAGEATATEPVVSPDVLDHIQHQCLSLYPPWLLAASGGGAPLSGDDVASRVVVKTDMGLFHSVRLEDLTAAFANYLRPGSTFLDLGSGDGRVVFMASLYGAQATGIEYDEQLDAIGQRALEALAGVVDRERIDLRRGDFFEPSWSGFDVIYYFDLGSFEDGRLDRKMAQELGPRARLLVAHERLRFPGLIHEARLGAVDVYRQPDPAVGRRALNGLAALAVGLVAAAWAFLRKRRLPRGDQER